MHVLIRDQAGLLRSAHPFGAAFGWLSRCARLHLRDGDPRLPGNLRIVDLPPYSPELNACEQLWDILKDDIANRVFPAISKFNLAKWYETVPSPQFSKLRRRPT